MHLFFRGRKVLLVSLIWIGYVKICQQKKKKKRKKKEQIEMGSKVNKIRSLSLKAQPNPDKNDRHFHERNISIIWSQNTLKTFMRQKNKTLIDRKTEIVK